MTSSTRRPPTSIALTPSLGLVPRRCAPRCRNGSSAPESCASPYPRKAPWQSASTPIVNGRSSEPQPPATATKTATAATRSACLPCICRHPDPSRADGDLARRAVDGDAREDRPGARVDPGDLAVEGARDPDRSSADGDTAHASADPDRLPHEAVPRVEPRDDVVDRACHPDAPGAGCDRAGCEREPRDPADDARPRIDAEDAPVDGVSDDPEPALADRHVVHREPDRLRGCGPPIRHELHHQRAKRARPRRQAFDERAAGDPDDPLPGGDGARGQLHPGLARAGHGVVAGDGAVEDVVTVACDVDGRTEAREIARLAGRREAPDVTARRVEAPERAVPE